MNLGTYRADLKNKTWIYKAYIGLVFIFLLIGKFYLKEKLKNDDFLFGILHGFAIGIELFCFNKIIKIIKASEDIEILKQMYIKENDEREIFINLKSGFPVLVKLSIAIFIAAILAGFINKVVCLTLITVGICQLLISKVIKLYWSNKV